MGQKLKPETKRMKPLAYWFLVILILATAGPRKDILPEDAQQQLQRIETRLNEIYNLLEYPTNR
jgi:hypothetical protein